MHTRKTDLSGRFLMLDVSFFLARVWGLVLKERGCPAPFKDLVKTGFYESPNDIITIANYAG